MRKRHVVAAAAGAAAAGSGARAYVRQARRTGRHDRMARTVRIWRLTARRALHWLTVKVRGAAADEARKAELEQQFVVRSAEDVTRELGQMKGVVMKVGQLVSFIAEGLPAEAREVLAGLQADAPPMAPSLAAQVVREELGADPERLFLDWNPVPVAAASVGQVHRAVLRDGREVAVKVQYPGVGSAIGADLDNAELLYRMFSTFALRGLDAKALVDELRDRMGDELDYALEARNQQLFADLYRDHPFIHVPDVVPRYSTRRVLTSSWVDGQTWAEFEATAATPARQRAGEVLFRFAQGSIHRHGVFNGDPHPGNYRFHPDGSVTFLDFGLVKRWTEGEWERLSPCLDAIVLDDDPVALLAAMEHSGFLAPGHGLSADAVYEYVSAPYRPYLTARFTFTPAFVAEAMAAVLDIDGPHAPVIRKLNMPPSFVILDRVVWGVSALLGRLGAEGPWRAILAEYRRGAPPATALGAIDAAWASRPVANA